MLKTIVKCMAKTAEDSAKEATPPPQKKKIIKKKKKIIIIIIIIIKKIKKNQHILLKVQDTVLAAREAHYHATCRRDYSREDDRHQETIKDTFTKRKRKLPTRP